VFGLGTDGVLLDVLALAEDADVFLSDRRPGLGERMGIGDTELGATNRGLIRCWVRGADRMTALIAVQAILAALYGREQTGRGERIDVAIADVMAFVEAPDSRYRGLRPPGETSVGGAIDRCPARPTGRAGSMVSSLHRRKNDN
jgi:crotonobetainyl-CoA:carnitine CoA-transferase CaiB-like acyl-CoA transferase